MASPTAPPEGAGIERRAFPRYHLVRPLKGFVEHGEERYPGSVLDVSVSGFLLYVPGGDGGRFLHGAGTDFGEVVFGDKTFGGFGNIAGVRRLAGGTGVGFKWDAGVYQESRQTIDELIADLAQRRQAGSVRRDEGVVRVFGHLSVALSVDLHSALAAGANRLCLADTLSLDSSGLNLLLDLQKAGIGIGEVHPDIVEPLKRFRLIDDA